MKNFKSLLIAGLTVIALACTIQFVSADPSAFLASLMEHSSAATFATIFPMSMASGHMQKLFHKLNEQINPVTKRDPITKAVLKRDKKFILAPSYLRIEQDLVNSKSTYDFNPLRGGAATGDSVTENKLDRNDLFVAGSVNLFLYDCITATPSKHRLQSFPNVTIFTQAVSDDLNSLYNGRLSFKVGTKVNVDSISMLNFLHAPETQQSAITNYSSFSLDGTALPLPSEWRVRGDNTNTFTIQADTYAALAWANVTAGHTNRMALILNGFLVKNYCAAVSATDLDNI